MEVDTRRKISKVISEYLIVPGQIVGAAGELRCPALQPERPLHQGQMYRKKIVCEASL